MNQKNAFSQQEVSTALELLASTLEDERIRIYDIGANAMKALDADTALAVIGFAKKLEAFQAEVKKINSAWGALLKEKAAASPAVQKIVDGEGRLFGLKTRKSASGYSRKVEHPLAPRTNFTVKFSDGTLIQHPRACDVFVAAIEHIGASRVQALGLLSCGEPLVAEKISSKYPRAAKQTASGLYVSTQSSTSQKIQYLKTIAKLLTIKLEIRTTSSKDNRPVKE